MSFSRESRYRNVLSTGDFADSPRKIPPALLIGCLALLIVACCGGVGLLSGLVWGSGGVDNFTKSASLPLGQPSATPTLDKNTPVPLKQLGAMDNGLALTVINVQRPLKVQGGLPLPSDQQFILATVQITNTKKTGTALKTTAADFKATGDGGLIYGSNPNAVTIPNLLNEVNVSPGKMVEAELIFQIAVDDSGLKLLWKVGTQTRTFLLEK